MAFKDHEQFKEYSRWYQSAANMWRPMIFKTDLSDPYIKALKIQSQIDETTVSAVVSRYVKDGLAKDGRLKNVTG